MTDVWGVTPSELAVDRASLGIGVFTVTLGSVVMSFCGCGISSVEAGIPEMFGVTGVSEDVRVLAPTKLGDFDPVKRVRFVRNSFVSRVNDS